MNHDTIIIYISSKSNYAMQLFQVMPLGFLLKPLATNQVEQLLSKSIQLYEKKNQIFEYYSKGNTFKLPYKEILYFYSENKKINIVLKNEVYDLLRLLTYIFIHIHHFSMLLIYISVILHIIRILSIYFNPFLQY